jgi:hypothetical protein
LYERPPQQAWGLALGSCGAILRQPRNTVAGQEQRDDCGDRGGSEEIDQKRHGFTFWRAVSPTLGADN